MTRTRIILLISVLLVFAAGTSLGFYISRRTQPPPPPPSRLSRDLDLTPEQQKQMEKIWDENVGQTFWQKQDEARRASDKQRDNDIAALLTDEQKTKYDAIQKDYRAKMDELAQERRKAFDLVNDLTRKMLTPEQVAKFDERLKKQHERGPGPGPGPGDFRGTRHRHPASASEPNPSQQPPHGEEQPPADMRNP